MHITEELVALMEKHGDKWPEHLPDDIMVIDLEAHSPGNFVGKFIDLFNLDDYQSGTFKCDWYYGDDVLYIKKET